VKVIFQLTSQKIVKSILVKVNVIIPFDQFYIVCLLLFNHLHANILIPKDVIRP
jgi:hypothetical protein